MVRMLTHSSDALYESLKAWIRSKRIEAGRAGEPEEVAIAESVGGFEPIESRIRVAESRIDHREGDRWSMALCAELFEFPQKALGFVRPAQPAIDMPQVGKR